MCFARTYFLVPAARTTNKLSSPTLSLSLSPLRLSVSVCLSLSVCLCLSVSLCPLAEREREGGREGGRERETILGSDNQ